MAAPPSFAGAVKLTVAILLPPSAMIAVGASGAARVGVTADEAAEAVPVPTELAAVTVKV